ncbi:diguanylate cyclase [Conexibacter sp. DBS9H8]|uniref:GGDEF domain-containing protein n=1 Tax=Conexibacter sp. DBS9H8 TaxID=2937801 RepID=UPI00200FDD31|nr:diguanylate cyclase [Conexibacter sp. DBS9H8]
MSFANRLTTFFVLMVLVPIVGIGVLGFRLIDATSLGRAGARADGLITAASGVYAADERLARGAAEAVAEAVARLPADRVQARIAAAARAAGLVRIEVIRDGRRIATYGSASAVAPGVVALRVGRVNTTVTASLITARQYVQAVTGPLSAAVLSRGPTVLASSLRGHLPAGAAPTQVTVAGTRYATARDSRLAGFDGAPITLVVLSNLRASTASNTGSDVLAVAFLGGLALLAFGFAGLASRGLNEMVKRFLAAATRLAARDFSVRVPVEGQDEFAHLATAFNTMSDQLEEYIARLDAERVRLREAIRRTGETFESSRDRQQLEALTLETAITGLEAEFGRLTRREDELSPLRVRQVSGDLTPAGPLIMEAERIALNEASFGEASGDDLYVIAARMGTTPQRALAYGTLVIGRRGRPFSAEDMTLFRSLAGQAWRALDNVRLHDEAERKAVTDLLTGLANHGEFQAVLHRELEGARRYHYPVGLILLDLDDFKAVNDTHGHLQGDAVLRAVAHVLAETSREGDTAARYGGEELALILPHTDLDGAFTIAERIRASVAELRITRVDGDGPDLRVTASVGVSASITGPKDELIAEADSALYAAKRTGKNRTVRSAGLPAAS